MFTDLDEALQELGYSSILDINYASGRARRAPDGFSNRPIPKYTRKTDQVSIDELAHESSMEALWNKRLARATRDRQARTYALQTVELEELRELWYAVRDGRFTNESSIRMHRARKAA